MFSCCYHDNCNDGRAVFSLPQQLSPSLSSVNNYFSSGSSASQYQSQFSSSSASSSYPSLSSSYPSLSSSSSSNQAPSYIQQFSLRNGNCEHYFDKSETNEWIPDTLIPLAFDRASESRVGVFYTKMEEGARQGNHIIVRILDKSKHNKTMYSIHLFRGGSVSINLDKLEPVRSQNSGESYVQASNRKIQVNTEIDFEKSRFQGFWIAVRNGIDVSIGLIGDKIINPIASFSDVMREGPSDPYYFGLTVSETTSADFGLNCDMPGLHFDDTCVTNDDCSEFPNTGENI